MGSQNKGLTISGIAWTIADLICTIEFIICCGRHADEIYRVWYQVLDHILEMD